METSGVFSGIPLASVKTARYLNKAGTFFTLAKLVLNGKAYDFNGVSKGSVVMTADALGWAFTAPDGRFDLYTLSAMSTAGMLESMASSCESSPVEAWEDFAAWLSEDAIVEQVNAIFSGCTRAAVAGVDVDIPVFTVPGSFPAFVRWLASVMGDAASLPASEFRNADNENRFDVTVDLYQPDGTEEQLVGYRIVTPTTRPEAESLTVFSDGDKVIFYNDNNGTLSLPCLFATPSMCPTFSANYAGYDYIMYVYEPTSDNLGLDITMNAGWYAINMSTFDLTLFDLTANPIEIMLSGLSGSQTADLAYFPQIVQEIRKIPEKLFAAVAFRFQV